ncbi:MAG: 16S rRNA (uracil(1498)-N(3))-methyltransferase [Dysgonamonadaceae bacterium]|jgi:16S rRNA (uracil1498-N3)-methyltransferase|nr:16S rRNA (uracil(1498)-N(3))-methyltransferase [Dysgonamonadaceae bacterium]
MHLFYTPDIQCLKELPDDEAKHCFRVLRLTVGDEILLTDGKGFFYKAVLLQETGRHCPVEILETIPSPLPWKNRMHIAMAPTKNMDRVEWFVEKATEIGVNELSFLQCRFSERRELKTERLEKILVSAMKQSRKAVLPVLNGIKPFNQFVRQPFDGQKFIAHCYPGEKELLKNVCQPHSNALILIGPEGDFSEEEVTTAQQSGFIPVSLGESRLRTETAALVACNTLQLLQAV